jgi:G3E family GTPase
VLKPRYLMIGGFLGAGKTTAILQLASRLRQTNARVGLITNDQSSGLVDTTLLRSSGFTTEEITGGCFCCRFDSLMDAARKLTDVARPDVFIAEPVGSCTDLQATVTYPLYKMYGDNYAIAPLSVVLDPVRTARVIGLESGKTFSQKVRYIFEKQLEEADVLVINKCDAFEPGRQDELQGALAARYPRATILRVSARTGDGIDAWLDLLTNQENTGAGAVDVNYDVYAEGESLLGWLNLSAAVEGKEFDGNAFLARLGTALRDQLEVRGIEVAHLKMTLAPEIGNDVAVGNLVRSQGTLELSHRLAEPVEEGVLLVNLRAEGAPEELKLLTEDAVAKIVNESGLTFTLEHLEAFRPGRPEPTHRLVQISLG